MISPLLMTTLKVTSSVPEACDEIGVGRWRVLIINNSFSFFRFSLTDEDQRLQSIEQSLARLSSAVDRLALGH